ncbi:MAG: hypothetical protein NWS51_02970 [Flavobacteriales bacterium]|nr:hypothetical protein [Flavobacteriales bacterium]
MNKMKGLLVASICVLALVSCEEKKVSVPSRSAELIGDFDDTLWNQNSGTIYSLALYADSSFYLRTRVLGGEAKTFLGNYKPNEKWDVLNLKCADSTNTFAIQIKSADLLEMNVEGGVTYMNRSTKVVGTSGSATLKNRVKLWSPNKSIVYQLVNANELIIDQLFINTLTPEYKALLSYYSGKYESPQLVKSLNFSQEEIVKLQELYFPNPPAPEKEGKEAPPIEDKKPMKSLFFMNIGGKVEVQLVALSSKGNDYAKKDTWELNAEGWKLVNSEFAGVNAQVVYDNPNEVQLPKGNIIINNK